jgi:flagellar M-ring protein FliF
MNKIMEFVKSIGEKWKSYSTTKKVSFILILVGIIFSTIFLVAYLDKASYDTLYSNLDPEVSAQVIEKLKTDGISYRVEGDSILVPKDMVAELRMSNAADMQSVKTGFEIFDQGKFGVTDTEAQIMYQRALEGELARSIESLDEVDSARVHLVLPDESVFARETQDATASVIIKEKGLSTLSPEQVKAIIALVSGSVESLPQKNVQVLDSNANLLSENIFDDTSSSGTVSATKQQEFERQFEDQLQVDVKGMLEEVFGQGNIAVKVNSDLNFDSKQTTTIKYDKDNVVQRSLKTITEKSSDTTGTGGADSTGTDPQFDTTEYPVADQNGGVSTYEKNDETVNNEIGQVEDITIKAPGEVTRMTVSVVIDGSLNDTEKNEIKNIVATAVGYDQTRGDSINISALPFNTDKQDKVDAELAAMEAQAKKEERTKLYTRIGIGAGALILMIVLLSIISKNKKKNAKPDDINQGLDVVVGDTIIPKQPNVYENVLDDQDTGDMSLEKELQSYATKKPEQVAEVIRTWLSDDESR